MKKWCAYQKEGFGIFYALKKWRHLLLDRKFTLRTDCRNLSFLEKDNDSKVLRWLTTFQEYEFEVEHVPGKDNFVADAFSRLCALGGGDVEEVEEEENDNDPSQQGEINESKDLIGKWKGTFLRAVQTRKAHQEEEKKPKRPRIEIIGGRNSEREKRAEIDSIEQGSGNRIGKGSDRSTSSTCSLDGPREREGRERGRRPMEEVQGSEEKV